MKKALSIVLAFVMLLTAFPAFAVSAETAEPAIVVGVPEEGVHAGDTFTATVNTVNNPGIISVAVKVGYDAAVLELVSIAGQDFAGTSFGPLTANPIAVNWYDALNPNNTTDGVLATLTFKVKEDAAAGDTAITLTHNPNNIYDYDFNNVTFAMVEGIVSVHSHETVCEHVYDNACDADCNLCGAIRTPADHVYSNASDATCNVCGAIRDVSVGDPTFVASVTEGNRGDTVTVTVSTKNNPGIVSLLVRVGYDANVLELVSIKGQDFAGMAFGPLTNNPIAVNWYNALSPNNTTNGVVAVLTFRVKDNAPIGDTAITLSYNPEDVYDYDFNNVYFATENGKVTVHGCQHWNTTDIPAKASTCISQGHDAYVVCDDCGAIIEGSDAPLPFKAHVYSNTSDATCNVCGAIRDVSVGDPTFVASVAEGSRGDTVTVTVSTKNNPGIVSLKVDVGYDADVLELVSIKGQDFAGMAFAPLTNNPIAVNWFDAINPNNTTDGVVAVLTFKIKDNAPIGDTAITLSYNPEDVYDYDFNNVYFATENGKVTVLECQHVYDDDYDADCNECGEVREVAPEVSSGECGDNLTWTLYDNGTLVISGEGPMWDFGNGPWGTAITEVIIGDGVTSVGKRAFWCCTGLISVAIGDSVTSIENEAFIGCSSLTSITIPASVTSIGYYAFFRCDSVANITVDENNENYCSVDGVLFNKDKTKLYNYPSGNLRTSYTIPESVTSIEYGAFSYCAELTWVTVPASVTSIGVRAFASSGSLTSITVDANNPNYCSVDGVLFNKDRTELCAYPADKLASSYTIPESVTSIRDFAFDGCVNLVSVTIPVDVASIGYDAFGGCPNLTIYGYRGSAAETYAAENTISFVMLDKPTFVASVAEGSRGDTVTVTVSTKNNPGIVSLKVDVGYDANVLELKAIQGQDFAGMAFGPLTNNPIAVNWVDAINPNNTTDGVVAVLTFKIKDNAPIGDTAITLSYDFEYVYDYDFNDVYFATENGKVTVLECQHVYDNACDADCNECGAIRTTARHYYTNACDASCNVCGAIRTITHYYTNACDISCNVCGEIRTITHAYDNDYDVDCNVCGYVREIVDATYGKLVAHGTCGDNLVWVLYEGGTLVILGEGEMWDYEFGSASWGTDIIGVVIGDGVTSIGEYAFSACYSLVSLEIPDSVTSIGRGAFMECTSLTEITIPDGIECIEAQTFDCCTSLRSVIIPDTVTSVGTSAFASCHSLGSITIPVSVTSIALGAFEYCDSLTDVWYTGSEEDRAAIAIDTENEPLTSATWHYDACPVGAEHTYSNACDRTCNVCGATRTPSTHVYDNGCDPDCNVCGAVRTTLWHSYTNACDPDCNVCGATREITRHYYTNACDISCNVCGLIRPITHYYTDDCDISCNVCGAIRTPPHAYDNACDAECDCGEVREVPDHVYDDDCDTDCNECGDTRVVPHKWENACDAECECGATRVPADHVGGIATCHEKAVCDVCGAAYGEFDPDNHDGDEVSMNKRPTACDEEGYTGDIFCGGCSELLIKGEAIAKIPHTYDNACDATCNVCGATRIPADHIYDNACDATCNVCNAEREVPDHVYDNNCDNSCNECGMANPNYAPHIYDNACDAFCNECGETREVPDHVYDNACDAFCNECNAEREVPDHVYDGLLDVDCNECGRVRKTTVFEFTAPKTRVYSKGAALDLDGGSINLAYEDGAFGRVALTADMIRGFDSNNTTDVQTLTVICAGKTATYQVRVMDGDKLPTFVVDSLKAYKTNETFTVALRLENNPGIVSMMIDVAYDTDVLELIDIEGADFVGTTFGPLEKTPIAVNWYDTLNPNNTTDGVVAVLTFKIKDDAPEGSTVISLSYDQENVYDFDFENVPFNTSDGVVEICDYLPGDADGDGIVNNKDLGMLMQYITRWDVAIDTRAVDVYRDGIIDNKDYGILQRYLTGWDVVLG